MAPRRSHQPQPPAARHPPQDAPGVTYFQVAGADGLKFFRCIPHDATLSQRGCADRWREGQGASGLAAERLGGCRGCPIGAAHAGETHVEYSSLYGAAICPRCRKGATRMIHNRICVNCYNRQREMRAGINRRGHRPVKLLERPLHAVEYRVAVDGRARRVRAGNCIDLPESMIQTLRTTKGEVAFGFHGRWMARQGRLL